MYVSSHSALCSRTKVKKYMLCHRRKGYNLFSRQLSLSFTISLSEFNHLEWSQCQEECLNFYHCTPHNSEYPQQQSKYQNLLTTKNSTTVERIILLLAVCVSYPNLTTTTTNNNVSTSRGIAWLVRISFQEVYSLQILWDSDQSGS